MEITEKEFKKIIHPLEPTGTETYTSGYGTNYFYSLGHYPYHTLIACKFISDVAPNTYKIYEPLISIFKKGNKKR